MKKKTKLLAIGIEEFLDSKNNDNMTALALAVCFGTWGNSKKTPTTFYIAGHSIPPPNTSSRPLCTAFIALRCLLSCYC